MAICDICPALPSNDTESTEDITGDVHVTKLLQSIGWPMPTTTCQGQVETCDCVVATVPRYEHQSFNAASFVDMLTDSILACCVYSGVV